MPTSHSRAIRSSCSTEAARLRHSGEWPSGIAASTWTGSGSVSSRRSPPPAISSAGPRSLSAASSSTASASPPRGLRTVNAALASSVAATGERPGITRWIAPTSGGYAEASTSRARP